MNIASEIIEVLENYLTAKKDYPMAVNEGKHFSSLSQHIPKQFNSWINKFSKFNNLYQISFSHGKGNWAEIPWVVCANTNITDTAQKGYYIVLGFSADMQSCFLSLNQGVSKTDKNTLRDFANVASGYTKPSDDENVIFGKIDFKAKNTLGKNYGLFAIKSFNYSLEQLKQNNISQLIERQFKELLDDYDNIYTLVGNDILNLQPITDFSYQQQIQQNSEEREEENLNAFIKRARPNKLSKKLKYYSRNPKYSKVALKLAKYKCEINPEHETFHNGKHSYMEGHHLIPMSQQDFYTISLDVPSNIISLCPTCHKALHYGNHLIKKEYLMKLFHQRESILNKCGIHIETKELIKIYTKGYLDDMYD